MQVSDHLSSEFHSWILIVPHLFSNLLNYVWEVLLQLSNLSSIQMSAVTMINSLDSGCSFELSHKSYFAEYGPICQGSNGIILLVHLNRYACIALVKKKYAITLLPFSYNDVSR